jgi:N4-gp56 family major capsid protein
MADPLNSGMGPAAATATLAPTFRVIYEKQLLKNARNNLVHNMFGRKRKLKNGATMNIRRSTPLAVATTALTEGTPPAALSFEITEQTITALQYGAYVSGTDVVTAVAFDPLLNEISVELGAQAGETLDTVTRDVLVAGTNIQYAGTGNAANADVAATDVLNTEELVKARTTLRTANVPFRSGSDYDAIIHPLTHADLLRDTTIRAAFNSGDHKSELYDGYIGRFMGIKFHESALAKVLTGAGTGAANLYPTLVFGKDAYSVADIEGLGLEFIFKGKESGGTSDPLEQLWTSGWKATHGATIERQTYMLRIVHGATNG